MHAFLQDIDPQLFYPFTLTRGVGDIRFGINTINEKSPQLAEQLCRSVKNITDIFKQNDKAIIADFEVISKGRTSAKISSTNRLINPAEIFFEAGAKAEHCIFNASTGPIYVGKNAEIMEGSIIRGPFAMGEGSVVKLGAKIYGATSIGPYCTVGGEIKNSILFGYSNKAHDGYLGDSILGEWCNLGAGTTNSNVKNTATDVRIYLDSIEINAGLKCGLLMGDYSRAAINTAFNTGTVVGVCCNVFGSGLTFKNIRNFSWGNEGTRYELPKAIRDIGNWKKLKGKEITEEEIKVLEKIYADI